MRGNDIGLSGGDIGLGEERPPREPAIGAAATTSPLGPPIAQTALRLEVPAQRGPESPVARPVTMRRIGDALDRLEIRYLTDDDGSLLAMWERHAVLFALEGPDDEILVMRGRPHGTVPPGLGRPGVPGGQRVEPHPPVLQGVRRRRHRARACCPIYAEIQVPLLAGVHDALLDEMLDCAAAVTSAFVDWLYDDGGLL